MSLLSRFVPERRDNAALQGAPEERYLSGSAFVPPAYEGMVGDIVGEFRAMQSAAVFACVKLIADTIASMPWYVYKRDKDNLPRRIYPTPKVISKPCPEMDLWQWKWMVIFTLALRGNSFHYITGRDSEGNPTGLMPLHPDLVFVQRRVNILEWYDPIYRVMGDRIPSCDMVHIRRYTVPGQPIGLTPIQQMAHSIGVNLSAQQYGLRYFKDSANPSSVLKTDQSLPDDEIERIQKEWVSTHGGRRLPAVLSGGFDWKAITINPEESQFLETLRYTRSDISMFFGVPPHMIGDVERSTSWGTGVEQMSLGFNTYTIGGWTSCFESAFSALLPKNHFVRFDPAGLLRGDLQARYQSYKAARDSGWLSVNEIRAREELPPVDGGDTYLQPLNYGPLGTEAPRPSPAPQDPEPGLQPTPPSAGTPAQEGH